LQNSFVPFSFIPGHYTYRPEIFGNKLWDASTEGLFYMSLSNLPGISGDDTLSTVILPVQFVFFNANCEDNNVLLRWKTAQELNSSHFSIERSRDGINWTSIGNQVSAGTSNSERNYSFVDHSPLPEGYYRIAEFDLDGKVQYTGTIRSACHTPALFRLRPNPVRDLVYIDLTAAENSMARLQVFDSKGALVRMQENVVLAGQNQLSLDMKDLTSGLYTISVYLKNGKFSKTVQVVKQ
jgi:hypothetical protein